MKQLTLLLILIASVLFTALIIKTTNIKSSMHPDLQKEPGFRRGSRMYTGFNSMETYADRPIVTEKLNKLNDVILIKNDGLTIERCFIFYNTAQTLISFDPSLMQIYTPSKRKETRFIHNL